MVNGFAFASSVSPLSYLAEGPDLGQLDPNVAVHVKSLSAKKDDATKTRALGELLAHARSQPFAEGSGDAVLAAWARLYPRAAIDISPRVRELSHTLQCELMRWARKRMERQLPKLVGTWLAGAFDRHRPAARAAADGISSFLTTPEKTAAFWTRCQPQILEYALEAARETIETICDDRERAAKPDESRLKYLRVMGGALGLVAQLLALVDGKSRQPHHDLYSQFLSLDQVWEMASSQDAVLRTATYRLLGLCLDHEPAAVKMLLPRIRQLVVRDGLLCDQTGSSAAFVTTLTKLTAHHPEVWKDAEEKRRSSAKKASGNSSGSNSSKSTFSALLDFIEKGSQGGTGVFWVSLDKLLTRIPLDPTLDTAETFARCMRRGVAGRQEPRNNHAEGWACYIEHVNRFSELLPSDAGRLTSECLFPLTTHFVTQEPSVWATGAQIPVLLRAHRVAAANSPDTLHAEWNKLADNLMSRISASAASGPEPPPPNGRIWSQNTVSNAGERWFSLVGAILHRDLEASPILEPSRFIVSSCCDLLERETFRPFGAAAVLEWAAQKCPTLFGASESSSLASLVRENVQRIMPSPSAPHLFSVIAALGNSPNQEMRAFYKESWPIIVKSVLDDASEPPTADAIVTLMSNDGETAVLGRSHTELQDYLVGRGLACEEKNDPSASKVLEVALTFATISDDSLGRIVRPLVDRLGPDAHNCDDALRVVEMVAERRPDAFASDERLHVDLVTKLLSLSQISSGQRVSTIRAFLDQTKSARNKSTSITIIQSNLSTAGPQSLDVETLVEQALLAAKTGMASWESLVPHLRTWMQELLLFFQLDINPASSISNSLRGAQFLIPAEGRTSIKTSRRDRSGASIPVRMASYTLKLMEGGFELSCLPTESQIDIAYFLSLTCQLAKEQVTTMSDGGLWESLSSGTTSSLLDAETLIQSASKQLNIITANEWAPDSLLNSLVQVMVQETRFLKPAKYFTARALADVLQSYSGAHGFSSKTESLIQGLDLLKATPEAVLGACALLGGFGELLSSSKPVIHFCNKMVSEVLGASPAQEEKILLNLVLLNAVTSVFSGDDRTLPVASNRVVFAVKRMASWLADPDQLSPAVATEVCRALRRLLPCIAAVYGDFWSDTTGFIIYLLHRAEGDAVSVRLSYIHAALQLEDTLKTLADGQGSANDDLRDALHFTEKERAFGCLDLLSLPRASANSSPQIEAESLLCQRASEIPLKYVMEELEELDGLYHLLSSESRELQTAAFDLLHRALPEYQQEYSVNVILDKTTAKLPDELLSLLLEPPTLEQYTDDELQLFPTPIRCYLLTWHLVFDSFSTASHRVRSDYTAHLKSKGNFLPALLEFTFDVLGHSAASPLKLDKEGLDASHIRTYDMAAASAYGFPEEKSMHWLMAHLVYQAFKFVPGLFRAWYLDCKHKPTKQSVQRWTEKYYSPLLVEDALDGVVEWAKEQDGKGGGDEKELRVRANKRAGEVVAAYEIDDAEASIRVKLAPDFPLGGVTVSSVNRVAASEQKWQNWLRITQGVILFSNGEISDGLTAFRRNISGALKGKSECSICFSIISEDGRTPEKECPHCHQIFHSLCLYRWLTSSITNTCPLCRNSIE